MRYGVSSRQLIHDFWQKINDDNIWDGAAALAFYMMLALFPAAIFVLTLLPFLPVPDLGAHIMNAVQSTLPPEAAGLLRSTVEQVTHQKRQGLLSFGLLLTLSSAASGMSAIMQQLNITYGVIEGRSFKRAKLTAIGLMLLFMVLIVGASLVLVFDQKIQGPIVQALHLGVVGAALAGLLRVSLMVGSLLIGFALMYYFGPDVEQRFQWISPGSVAGTLCLIGASLAVKIYVVHFNNFAATYGSLGAAIILMMSLYVSGIAILLGSELNALLAQYKPKQKRIQEKHEAIAA
jgi:membrane protein